MWVAGAAACASLSGLNEISSGREEVDSSSRAAEGGESTLGSDATATEVQPAGADGAVDRTPGNDAEGATAEAEAGVDAAAICRAQCSGCCDSSGMCHGGRWTGTCGGGGAACSNCASTGKACSGNGTCVGTAMVEAGAPPMCVVSKCSNTCPLLPLVEAPCCKSDQTCGCAAVLGILLCN